MKQEQLQSMQKEWLHINKGFSLIEVILSTAVFVLIVTALMGVYLYGEESTMLSGNRARATMLAEEGVEATRNIRDANFTNLTDGTYGLTTLGNQYNLSGSSDTSGIFNRAITVSPVDANRKDITSTVSWQQNAQRVGSVAVTSRMTFWQKIVTVIGDWTNPNTLAGSIDLSGNQAGLKIQVQGNYAYITRNINSNVNFLVIDISTPSSPSLVGSLTTVGTPTNLAVSGNYAYVSYSGDNNAELKIINISNPASPSQVGLYNAPGNGQANSVFIVGTTAYISRITSANDEFIILNVATPSAPSIIGSLGLSNTANGISVIGNYAYVATSDTAKELQVINISTPSTPTLATTLNLSGSSATTTIEAAGTVAVLGSGVTLYTVNISNPIAPVQLASYATGGTINDISLGNNNTYAFLANNNGTMELQIINITTPASPTLLGMYNTTSGSFNGVFYDSNTDRAYTVGTLSTSEFNVIAP